MDCVEGMGEPSMVSGRRIQGEVMIMEQVVKQEGCPDLSAGEEKQAGRGGWAFLYSPSPHFSMVPALRRLRHECHAGFMYM